MASSIFASLVPSAIEIALDEVHQLIKAGKWDRKEERKFEGESCKSKGSET